jgi:hypothetical protein
MFFRCKLLLLLFQHSSKIQLTYSFYKNILLRNAHPFKMARKGVQNSTSSLPGHHRKNMYCNIDNSIVKLKLFEDNSEQPEFFCLGYRVLAHESNM